jgi:energy-coupling factor transport system permease protein
MYHAKTWGLWLLVALLPVVLTKNPFYLLIAILAVGANYLTLSRRSSTAQGWETFLRAGLIVVFFSMLFNLLLVSAGDTVLLILPKLRWHVTSFSQQPVLIQIGGTVTLESLVYGLTTGLALLGVLVTFATFNTLVDHYQLLRSIPRFLYQSAIVTSIGITFVPHIMVAQREIREAQALRGHRFRFIRDLPPLFIALLAEGLERSITLAESMEARGFGSPPQPASAERTDHRPARSASSSALLLKAVIALALLILTGSAFARSYSGSTLLVAPMMLMGGGMLAAALWMVGQNVHRSRYRRDIWRRRDTLVAAASALAGLVILATWMLNRRAFAFYPYPSLAWPDFNPGIALFLLLLAMPALAIRLTGEPVGETAYD